MPMSSPGSYDPPAFGGIEEMIEPGGSMALGIRGGIEMKLDKKIRAAAYFGVFLGFSLAAQANGQKLTEEFLKPFHYRSIGPTRQGGRITDIAVPDRTKRPYAFYVACTGGLWKTANYGNSFAPVFDAASSIAVGDVEVSWSDPDIVWVGTGEPNFIDLYGDGVYKSTDAGKTWTHMGLRETRYVGRIRIHPANPDIVYAAALGHGFSDHPERGVYKTTDGGLSWAKSLAVERAGRSVGAVDLVMDPANPDVLYAATWDIPWGEGSGIFKTSDAGRSWNPLQNGLPSGKIGRIGLDICARAPRIVYATIAESEDHIWIYRTEDGGESWTKRGEAIQGGAFFGQIRVDPNNPETVYNFQAQMDKSTDGGKTWGRAWRWGGDWHALWINPGNSNNILGGYDYGFAMTHDGGLHWYHADELPLAQLYAVGYDLDYPYNVYGGMQDFGTWKGPSTNKGDVPIRFEDWSQVGTADGFYCQPDPSDSRWLYLETQYGGILRFDQKEGTKKTLKYEGSQDLRYNFNSPILISPHDSRVIYHGANVLLRSRYRGENWEVISPDLSNPGKKVRTRRENGTIVAISESPAQKGILWAGTDDGNIWLSTNDGKEWAKLNDRIPRWLGFWVTRVEASSHYAGRAYVTMSGLRWDDFRPYVYVTEDFGKTWKSISGGLPDEPVNVIREDRKNSNLLFIGTERGVFVSVDRGTNWTRLKNNLPAISIHDLAIHPRENDLIVGTHGRGFYITDISPLQELTPDVLAEDVHLFDPEPRVQWKIISQPARSAQNFSGENEPLGVVVNYYLREGMTGGVTVGITEGERLLQEIEGPGEKGINRAVWPFTWKRERTPEEQEAFKEQRGIPADSEGEWGQEYFDYYDQLVWYGREDSEVSVEGRSLMTRRHINDWETDPRFKYTRVRPGAYRIILRAGDKSISKSALILRDHWVKEQN
jgi:photosystem II stability/assembly factor-like uncharacterized protein